MVVSDNIKKLREEQGLTQQAFANRIGVKRNTVATYEMGRSMPQESALILICREFGVRLEWLKTGEGAMYARHKDEIIQQLFNEFNLDEKSRKFLEHFLHMNPENRELVIVGLEQLAKMYFHSEHVELLASKSNDELTQHEKVECVLQESLDQDEIQKEAIL